MSIVVFTVTAFAAILLVAALTVPAARWVGVPFSVLLAGLGLAYGVATSLLGLDVAGGALDDYDRWFVSQLALDSSTLLTVLLPPLLFEMALAVNVRRLLEDIATVLVMAILAVIAATAAVGLAVWGVSEFALIPCLILGAAVATTDPAAVVTTFREIGAPRRLLVILEGESLLNDAAAIAVFSLLAAALAGQTEATPAAFAASFAWKFAVGALTGLAVAQAAGALYPRLERSVLAETSVTVAVAYGAYLLAEQVLGGSGVVATVFAGLATGSDGVVRMGPGNWPRVRTVWDQIGFWANALILPIAASLVPGLVAELGWDHVFLVLVVYVLALLARAAILFGVLPAMDRLRISAPIGQRQKLLVLWGGVRGGVTLVLALSMSELAVLGEAAMPLAALAAAYTVATLLINASTLALATRLLGLDKLSPTDLALRDRIIAGATDRVRAIVSDLARARDLEPAALADVEEALGRQRAEAEAAAEADAMGARIPFGERLRVGLAIIAGRESRMIRRAFEEGAIGPRATRALRLVAERISDATRTGGREGYREAALAGARTPRAYLWAVFLHRRTGFDGPLRAQIELHLTKLLETERNLRELDRFARETVAPMVGEDATENICALLSARAEAVDTELGAVSAQYPGYARDLERTLIARAAIRRERQLYNQLAADGVIGQELHQALDDDLDARERQVARPPRLDLALSPEALVHGVPLFADLDEAQRRRLARRLRTRFTVPGEVVVAEGTRGTEMFFVASGVLKVEPASEGTDLLSSGDFFGEVALLRPQQRRRSSVISLGYCRLLVLTRRDFNALAAADPALDRIIRAWGERQLGRLPRRRAGESLPGEAE